MGTPREALPSVKVEDVAKLLPTINLPTAEHIEILKTGAEYHIICLLRFANDDDLILRVAGAHVPREKTENEVAVIAWLQKNTTIPVPQIVRYDAMTDNPLGCEYVLQKRLKGQSLEKVWQTLDHTQRESVLDTVADCLQQLNSHEWSHIGSLQQHNGVFVPGPVLDERFWEDRDIQRIFPGETVESLNPQGPFASYAEYSIARFEKCMYAIQNHPSLHFMRRHLDLMKDFVAIIKQDATDLSRTRLCLAHRDLHMGNIMYDTEFKQVTGVLDWEFSVVMPLQQGDLSRALLYDMQGHDGWGKRKQGLLATMRRRSRARGFDVLDGYAYTSEDQEEMQDAVDYLRAIVEVSPRGQREKERVIWMEKLVKIMKSWVDEDG